jgi:hypothetical protein
MYRRETRKCGLWLTVWLAASAAVRHRRLRLVEHIYRADKLVVRGPYREVKFTGTINRGVVKKNAKSRAISVGLMRQHPSAQLDGVHVGKPGTLEIDYRRRALFHNGRSAARIERRPLRRGDSLRYVEEVASPSEAQMNFLE